jgi:hypothetical protein
MNMQARNFFIRDSQDQHSLTRREFEKSIGDLRIKNMNRWRNQVGQVYDSIVRDNGFNLSLYDWEDLLAEALKEGVSQTTEQDVLKQVI